MMWLRKSKKGFTLIELMVVVAIIAILALLGLRLYSTQQEKAKVSLVKANAGSVQVALQTELVDDGPTDIALTAAGLPDLEQLRNPYDNLDGFGNAWGVAATAVKQGIVIVTLDGSNIVFTVTPYGSNTTTALDYILTARR
jgi:type IV pilus assembly protein PilA